MSFSTPRTHFQENERNILISADPSEGTELLSSEFSPLHALNSKGKADENSTNCMKELASSLLYFSPSLHFLCAEDANEEEQRPASQLQDFNQHQVEHMQFQGQDQGRERGEASVTTQEQMVKTQQKKLQIQLEQQRRQHRQYQQQYQNELQQQELEKQKQHQQQLELQKQYQQQQQLNFLQQQQQLSHNQQLPVQDKQWRQPKQGGLDSQQPNLLEAPLNQSTSLACMAQLTSDCSRNVSNSIGLVPTPNHTQNTTEQMNPASSKPQLLLNRPLGQFRCLHTDLEAVPEDSVPENPMGFTSLVPPAVLPPPTSSYNISHPSALKAKPNQFYQPLLPFLGKPSNPSPTNRSPGGSSLQSPFHGAAQTSPVNTTEFEPMNVLEDDMKSLAALVPATTTFAEGATTPDQKCDCHKLLINIGASRKSKVIKHACKRSRSDHPPLFSISLDDEDSRDGATSRQRRKGNPGPNDTKRRDCIKEGLDALQRALPHNGKPEGERTSQASILYEGGKFITTLKQQTENLEQDIKGVNEEIEELKRDIESLQSQLPENGAPMLPKVLSARRLADQFHNHVGQKSNENWRYWSFTQIMGYLVHSFDEEVAAATHEELTATTNQWLAKNMGLTQLRSEAYRKLAKLTRKTSILSTPSKLPEESLKFFSNHLMPADKRTNDGKM